MPATRSAQESAQRWEQRASSAAADYASRASAAGTLWAQKAAASGQTWVAGVSGGGAQGRFTAGVNRAGAQGYSQGVTTKGQARYGQGVAVSQEKFATRIAPYLALIQQTTVPARAPRGSPANDAIVSTLNHALAARRMGTAAAGR